MAVVVKGTVAPSIPVAGVVTLTYTDTSTGTGTVTARSLVISDANGNVLDTINMGSSSTATFDISADDYFSFVETLTDGSGTYSGTTNYLSTAFYDYLFPQLVAAIPTQNDTYGQIFNLTRAELYRSSAITFGTFGQGINSSACIVQANFYLQTPYYAN